MGKNKGSQRGAGKAGQDGLALKEMVIADLHGKHDGLIRACWMVKPEAMEAWQARYKKCTGHEGHGSNEFQIETQRASERVFSFFLFHSSVFSILPFFPLPNFKIFCFLSRECRVPSCQVLQPSRISMFCHPTLLLNIHTDCIFKHRIRVGGLVVSEFAFLLNSDMCCFSRR